jgi:hypothetical protein
MAGFTGSEAERLRWVDHDFTTGLDLKEPAAKRRLGISAVRPTFHAHDWNI